MQFDLRKFKTATPAEISGLSLAVGRNEANARDLINVRATEEGAGELRFFHFSQEAYATWWNSKVERITTAVRKRNRRFVTAKLVDPMMLAFIAIALFTILETEIPELPFTYKVAVPAFLMLVAVVAISVSWRDIRRHRKDATSTRVWCLLDNKAVRTGLAVADEAVYFAPYSDDACERSALRVGYGDIQSVSLDEQNGDKIIRFVDASGKSYSVTNPEGPAGENAAMLLETIESKIAATKAS